MKHGKKSVGWEKCIQTKERIVRILLAASCLAFCAAQVHAQAPVVAIHDSELTRALETMPASPPTPTGGGATGYQWWPTDWHYFVMPESMEEALRSDGTAFTVIGDSNITAGLLLPNGAPKYPIVISLASEAIRDDEIAPLTNYVAAGGFLLVGSSAFTRNPNGTGRGDFAFANALGLHTATPGLTNWAFNQTITRRFNHRLVSHLPDGSLTWRMPSYSEETSWGISPSHQFLAPHDIWRAAVSDATVIVQGDGSPFLAVKPFGKGYFIYAAGFQPLIGHGGFAPGMYAYVIFRKAIEWAFENAKEPVVKVSPWPFAYDAGFMVRHDLENFQNEIAGVEASAQVEHNNGIKGDYYFCTGTLRQDMGGSYDTNAVIASLQRAVTLYGATIGPHNGGLKNANNLSLAATDYDFWHWGPDEALDTTPSGYVNGKAYALASLSAAFSDIESWLPGLMTNGLRVWVAPSFNATREDSYDIQSQLGVKITGDQKLTPFPHWVVSTRTSAKRYTFLSEPVSDWFVGGLVAQSLEPWHPPGVQTSSTMHNAVDFYYGIGALINFYSHTLSTGVGDAGQLVPDYINYCLNTNLHPRMWPANAIDVYQWWQRRGAAHITTSYATNGHQSVASAAISGATDPNTTVEFLLPAGAVSNLQVLANGAAAPTGSYRTVGQTLKLRVGSSVTSAQISYVLLPAARNDLYTTQQGTALSVAAPGVLANDSPGMGTSLTATLVSGPANGAVNLNADGSFTYTPNSGFSGSDSFTYRVSNGVDTSSPATVQISIMPAGVLFADDFTSSTDPAPIDPWVAQDGTWMLTGGQLSGQSSANNYGNAYYDGGQWSDYTVQGRIRFSSSSEFGGGIGGHLNSANGAHYGAWIYPDASAGGPNVLRLIKFEVWTTWSFTPMAAVNLPPVGTNWHTLALTFQGANISVSFDGSQIITAADNNFDSVPPYLSGGITVDMYSDGTSYNLFADDILVTTPVSATPPTITSQPASVTANAGSTVMFSVTASGAAPLSYSWFKNGTTRLSDGGNVSGSATPTLTLANVTASDGGDYSVVVSNQAGTVTSSPARLTVITATPPAIVSQPQSQTVNAGQSASFSVTATGTAPLSYSWFKNGTTRLSDGGNVSGSATPMLRLANVTASDGADYTVVVSNQAGTVTSSPARLTVVTATPPSIVSQPQSQTVNAGQSASFSVTANGTAPLSYAWTKNGTRLSDSGNITGSSTTTLTVANVGAADAGNYAVIVSNQVGSVVSSPATLTVITTPPPSIVSQPQSRTVIAGQSASFSVSASGTAPLRFQWRRNGANIAGATASTYTLANAQPANAGQYTVVVSNNGGVATSAPATLAVNYSLTVTTSSGGSVSIQPNQSSYAPGTSVTLKASPSLLFKFTGWSGNASGTANPLTITMNGNKQIKANFALLGLLGLP